MDDTKFESFVPEQRPLSTNHPALRQRRYDDPAPLSHYKAPAVSSRRPGRPSRPVEKSSLPPRPNRHTRVNASGTAVASTSSLPRSDQSSPNPNSAQVISKEEYSPPPPLPPRPPRQSPMQCSDTAKGESCRQEPDQPSSSPSSRYTSLAEQEEMFSPYSSNTSVSMELPIVDGDASAYTWIRQAVDRTTYQFTPLFDWKVSERSIRRAARCMQGLERLPFTLFGGKVSMLSFISLISL